MTEFEKQKHLGLLRRCIEVSFQARAEGNTPFGALLADAEGRVLLTKGNVEVSERRCTGHAETALMEDASKKFGKDELWNCTLYTTAEPCAMCSGAIYWGNVGTVVYAISEHRLAELTGDDERNLTLDLPCRDVFEKGRKAVRVIGPFPELEQETIQAHIGYWR